jgi:8-oxo-dGTP diphosphatase
LVIDHLSSPINRSPGQLKYFTRFAPPFPFYFSNFEVRLSNLQAHADPSSFYFFTWFPSPGFKVLLTMTDVTCAIIVKDGRILATRRSEVMNLPLKWEFPGGKIEDGETAEDCLHRELKEELNIEIEIIKKLDDQSYDYDDFSINFIPFLSRYLSGDLVLSEHKDYKWLPKDELMFLDWAHADIPVMMEFLKPGL